MGSFLLLGPVESTGEQFFWVFFWFLVFGGSSIVLLDYRLFFAPKSLIYQC